MADATLRMLLVGEDRGASKTFDKVGDSADDAAFKARDFDDGLGDLGVRMSKTMTIAGAVGPALMFVGAALSAAAAGGVAIAGALGPAGAAGLAVYAGGLLAVMGAAQVAKFALGGIAEAAAGDDEAMKKLGPRAQAYAKTLRDLRPELAAVRSEARAGLLPGLRESTVELAGAYFPLLRVAARQVGDELGSLARRGADLVTSGPWRRDFAAISQKSAKNVGMLGRAGLWLADGARVLLATSMPLVTMFSRWAEGAAKSVSEFLRAKRASGELQTFWATAAERGAALGRILGDLAVGLFNIFRIGGGGQGAVMLTNLEGITEQFRAWTESSSGIESISRWFATGRENLSAMAGLIGDVVSGLSDMGSGAQLAPLIQQIRSEVIPPLMDFLRNASASGALQSLTSAVGEVLEVFSRLSEHDGSLRAFGDTLKAVATAAGWIVDNVPGAGDALAVFFTLAGAGAALKFAGLGGVVSALASGMSVLAKRFLIGAGAANAETGAITLNTVAHRISMSTAGTWLGVKALELGAWIRSTAAAGASAAATIASATAQRIAAGASKAWAAAQWLLNAALTANPIGLVIVGLVLLGTGLVMAYKKSETFRRVVDAGFRAVGKVAAWLWNNAIRPAVLAIAGGFGLLMLAWGKVLGALAKVPRFGWAKGASRAMTDAGNAALNLGDKIKKIPNSTTANVHAKVKGKADVDALGRAISAIRPKTVEVRAITRNVGTKKLNAVGDRYSSGGLRMVGERGPELVEMPRGARVYNDQDTARMTSGSSEPDFILVEVVVRSDTGEVIERKLSKHKRQRGGRRLAFEAK